MFHDSTDAGVKNAVNLFFIKQSPAFFEAGVHGLVKCYSECLDQAGTYVEKQKLCIFLA